MTNPNEQFDNEAKLTAYVLGELDPDEAAAIERQVESDESLRQTVETIRQTAELVGAELRSESAPGLTDAQRADIEREARDADSATDAEPPAPVIFTMRRMWIGTGLAAAACITLAIILPMVMQTARFSPSDDVAIAGKPTDDNLSSAEIKELGQRGDLDAIGARRAGAPIAAAPALQAPQDGPDATVGFSSEPTVRLRSVVVGDEFSREETERLGATMAGGASGAPAPATAQSVAKGETGTSAPSGGLARSDRPRRVPPPPPLPRAEAGGRRGPGGVAGAGPHSNQDAMPARDAPAVVHQRPAVGGAEEPRPEHFGTTANLIFDERDAEPDREGYDAITDNPFIRPTDQPLSTLSIDVDTAAYSNVRRHINQGHLPPKDAVRIEELINYFGYDDPAPDPSAAEPFAVNVEVGPAPWNEQHRLVRLGIHGREMDRDMRPATNLVFLIDVSGSMNNAKKLPLVQDSMRMLVNHLTPDDRVALAVYAGNAGLVLPSTYCHDKQTILDAIGRLRAGGSTAGGAGIQLAYDVASEYFIEGGVNRVILCTDGDFNVGISSDGELVRLIEDRRKTGVFLSVLGFGTGNFQDAKMEKITNAGNGNFAYIDSIDEAKKVLVEEMTGTLVTIAKDVKIQVDFNPKHVQAYRLIGYENRKLAARDFADDTKDAGEIGAGHSLTVLYEIVPPGVAMTEPEVEPSKYTQSKSKSAEPSDEATDVADAIAGDASGLSHELLEVRMRFKQPDGETSVRRDYPVVDEEAALESTSDDFRFAAAVAAFGMVLRDSPHKGEATLNMARNLAQSAVGEMVSIEQATRYFEDFMHYTVIAKPDLAAANARALLAANLSDDQLLSIIEEADPDRKKLDHALGRASKIEQTNPFATQLHARLAQAERAERTAQFTATDEKHRRGFIGLIEQASQLAGQ